MHPWTVADFDESTPIADALVDELEQLPGSINTPEREGTQESGRELSART
jgi:hypothetical protein